MRALLAGCLAVLTVHGAPPPPLRFAFGDAPTSPGIRVAGAVSFAADRGYGFDPGSPPRTHAHHVAADAPFLFSAVVPEGNYLVTVTLGDPAAATNTTVKAESRRLVLEQVVVPAGQTTTRTFAVNVRNSRLPPPPLNAPGRDHVELNARETSGPRGLVYHWDDQLTLEFSGPHSALVALEIVPAPQLPTLFLAGDSTVTDQPREPGASWGQMLPRFVRPSLVVANHAESGETLKSFLTALRFDKLLGQLRPGDYVLLQFGHNDSKSSWPQTYVEANTTYRAYLKVYVAEIRRRGATPVLVTSVQRRQFDDRGRIQNSHGEYPAVVRAVAREEGVALVDLERVSVAFYEALGPERARLAFAGDGRDVTHHNNYGAYVLAHGVAAALRRALPDFAPHLVAEARDFDPAKPIPPETFRLARSRD